jgi:hypothetical protein
MKAKSVSLANVYYINKKTSQKERKSDTVYRDFRCIPRSNDPTKPLSRLSRILSVNYDEMLKRSPEGKIFVEHEFISSITEVGNAQNNNLHKQLTDIFNIKYHYSVIFSDKKYRNGFIISYTENAQEILNNPEEFYTTKSPKKLAFTQNKLRFTSKKISSSIYKDKITTLNSLLSDQINLKSEKEIISEVKPTETENPVTEIVCSEKPTDIQESNNSTQPNKIQEPECPKLAATNLPKVIKLTKNLQEYLPLTKEAIAEIRMASGKLHFSDEKINTIATKISQKFPDKMIYRGKNSLVNYMRDIIQNEYEAPSPKYNQNPPTVDSLDLIVQQWRANMKYREQGRAHA